MAEQEYTPTEARLRDRVKGSLGEYAHEFGIDGEAAMDEWIDQALAERDNRVRADERAKVDAEIAMLRGAGKTLGTQIERAGRAIQEAVNRPDLLNGDDEGDWELVFELLARLRPRAEAAEQALAAERAKRPDREQIDRIQFEIDNVHQIHGDTCLCGFKSSRSRSRTEHLTALFAEAVLALKPDAREDKLEHLAAVTNINSITKAMLEEVGYPSHFHPSDAPSWAYSVLEEEHEARTAPEAREEPKHGLIEDYTAVQAPDWTKVSGKLEVCEITDAEVAVLYIEGETYGYATFVGIAGEGIVDLKMTRQQWHDLGNPKEVAVRVTKREAAREVFRG